jgi:precorrin-2 dehydrogenase / sirohydrochlorin ferrochelatase
MLPIVIDPSAIRAGVAGKGEGLKRRLAVLSEAGIQPRAVFDGVTPGPSELASLAVLFIAGLEPEESRELAAMAKAARVLVNVEDQPDLCDFHVPASVRRGDLLLTVSSGGQSPGLTRLLREELEHRFGPEWSDRVAEVARQRSDWRATGVGAAAVSERTRAFVKAKGWLQ